MYDWVANLIGKMIKGKLNLQEGTSMETKPWYTSKTIWTAVTGGLVALYGAISTVHPLPPIPSWVLTLLASLGLYGLRTADTKIS
jgi:hypothetical protein